MSSASGTTGSKLFQVKTATIANLTNWSLQLDPFPSDNMPADSSVLCAHCDEYCHGGLNVNIANLQPHHMCHLPSYLHFNRYLVEAQPRIYTWFYGIFGTVRDIVWVIDKTFRQSVVNFLSVPKSSVKFLWFDMTHRNVFLATWRPQSRDRDYGGWAGVPNVFQSASRSGRYVETLRSFHSVASFTIWLIGMYF